MERLQRRMLRLACCITIAIIYSCISSALNNHPHLLHRLRDFLNPFDAVQAIRHQIRAMYAYPSREDSPGWPDSQHHDPQMPYRIHYRMGPRYQVGWKYFASYFVHLVYVWWIIPFNRVSNFDSRSQECIRIYYDDLWITDVPIIRENVTTYTYQSWW